MAQPQSALRQIPTQSAEPFVRSYNPFNPAFRDTVRSGINELIGGREMGGTPTQRYRAGMADLLTGGVDVVPGVGEAVGVADTVQAARGGNYGTAAILGGATVLGMAPLIGDAASKAVRGAMKAAPDVPNAENALSGYDTNFPITHESSSSDFDGVIRNKTPYSVFDGIFGLGGVKGNMLGGGQGANYTYLPRTGKVAGSGDADLDYGKSVEFLKKQFPKASDDQIDSLYRATAEDTADFSSFEDGTFDGLLYGDAGERSWMAQNLRGKMAVDQGFDAVAMADENGTSYFIPYGSKAKNIGTNFDWDSYNSAISPQAPSPLEGTLDMSKRRPD